MLSKWVLILLVVHGNVAISKSESDSTTETIISDYTYTLDTTPYIPSEISTSNELYCPKTSNNPMCSSGMTSSGNCMSCNSCINETDVVINNFLSYKIVPQIISRPPTRILRVKSVQYFDVVPGDFVSPFTFGSAPTPATWAADPGSLYTMVYMNADINYIIYGTYKLINLSYLIINIPGNNVLAGDLMLSYRPHLPIPGYSPQRYVGLVYKQPKRIVVTQNLTRSIATTNKYDFGNFVETNNLGDPLFGNFVITWLLFNDNNQNYSC